MFVARAFRQLLALLLVVLLNEQVAHGQNSYIVTFPCTVLPGQDTLISVSLIGATSDVMVHGEIQTRTNPPNILGAGSTSVSAGSLGQLRIPTPILATGTKLNLMVRGTGGLTFTNQTMVTVGKQFSLFVQTDKGAYRPGQTVRMRVVSILPTLQPYTGTLNVTIEDSSKNRLGQWLSVQPTNGIWSMDFPVSDYPPLGNWTIKIVASGATANAVIEVREYVLPRFSVTVTPAPYIAREDSTDIPVSVSAQYTYGKPVRGTVRINFSLNNVYQYCFSGNTHLTSIARTATLSAAGVATTTLSRADFLRLFCSTSGFSWYSNGYGTLVVNASVTDQVSAEEQSGVASVGLYGYRMSLSVDSAVTQSTFKPGTKFVARFFLSTPDRKPVNNTQVTVFISGSGITSERRIPVTMNGVVNVVINVPRGATSMSIRAFPGAVSSSNLQYARQVSVNPSMVESPSKSYLQLSSTQANYSPGQTATIRAEASVSSAALFTDLYYQVFSRTVLVSHGRTTPAPGATSLTLALPIQARMGPFAKVVAYFVVNGEFVVDSLSLSVSNVLENSVNVSFDTQQARPNTNVTLSVSATSGSTVAVAVVDQSALLVRQANTITADGVIQALGSYDSSGRPIAYDGPVWALAEPAVFRRRRTVLPGPWYYGGSSASQLLANAGVCVITDFHVPTGRYSCYASNCFTQYAFGGRQPIPELANDIQFSAPAGGSTTAAVGQSLAVPDHTRDFFPETWLWTDGVAGSDGVARFNSVVPDSITSWVASAFAMSSTTGMGVSPTTARLRAFQPFFVSLNLPYSVIRGEEMVLQVNVFNYLESSQDALISLQVTDSLHVQGASVGSAATKTITIPAGEAQSALFIVTPQMVGSVPINVTAQSPAAADRVVRQLLVEAEGITKSYSRGVFLDLSSTASLSETLSLALPTETVEGSARAVISVIGDIMGPALSNLAQLLKMPSGCGEQNMIHFAPDVFITRYLTVTRQTSPTILEKAKRFMVSGYQRELRYWRRDYSFSAFGNRDSTGSLWLTAFVVKSFSQATPYIYVDPMVIDRSLNYLISRQLSSGSFPQVGMVHHQGLKGGLQGDVARTAYVLSALVEARQNNVQLSSVSRLDSVISSAQNYIASRITLITDNYTLAVSAYVLRLSNSPVAAQALQLLVARADRTGGSMYWQDSRTKTVKSSWTPPWRRATSADVELTAYGLLALTLDRNVADGARVARWLAAQRNSQGGFDSTQDTVVGLQALAEFAILVSASPPTMNIQMTSQGGASPFSQLFSVSPANSLVLQQTIDFPVPGTLVLSASGSGTAVLSVEVFYNIKSDDVIAFDMTSTCSMWKYGERLGATCRYCTHVSSAQYADLGMSLLEIGLPSGFTPDMQTVNRALSSVSTAGRVETPQRQVVFYLDEIGLADTCVEFDILQSVIIGKLQPSTLRTLNYYDPSISNANLYNVSTQTIPICCQCPTCDGCSGYSGACPALQTRPAPSSGAGGMFVSLLATSVCLLLSILI